MENVDNKLNKKIEFELERERIRSESLKISLIEAEKYKKYCAEIQYKYKAEKNRAENRKWLLFRFAWIVAILIFALTALFLFKDFIINKLVK